LGPPELLTTRTNAQTSSKIVRANDEEEEVERYAISKELKDVGTCNNFATIKSLLPMAYCSGPIQSFMRSRFTCSKIQTELTEGRTEIIKEI
jgi:hypothetical protein